MGLLATACATDVQQLSVPAPDARMFEMTVYPVLLRDCGFPACHGDRQRFFQVFGPGRTRFREGDGGTDNFEPATKEELEQTYDRARSMLAFEKSPFEALLLRKPLSVQAGGAGHKGTDNLGKRRVPHHAGKRLRSPACLGTVRGAITMRRAAIGVLMVLATNGSSSRARAYSDWELFGLETTLGGGGRRYFTGSPVDGYSCAVCHQGGTEPHVQVTGLPLTGYVPGQMYDVEVSWSDPKVPHALQLELVTKGGVSPGVVLVPDGPALDPRERCGANGELERATYLIQDRGRRNSRRAGLPRRRAALPLHGAQRAGACVRGDHRALRQLGLDRG